METIKTYYQRPDLDQLGATILEKRDADGRTALVLDATILYPEGGGQPADRGTINGIPVTDVQESDGLVLHFVSSEEAATLSPGPAELRLDAVRRRDYTVQHTAQHLLSATILRLTGAPTVSMHLGEETCTIDVDAPDLAGSDLTAIEEAANDIIEADYTVILHLCPPENIDQFPLRKKPPRDAAVIRVLEIDGYDYSPCGGTHLRSTAHIGMLKILGAEKYKGMSRITFIAGRRVLREYRGIRSTAEGVSKALKVPITEIDQGVAKLLERLTLQDRTLLTLREQTAQYEAERIAAAPRTAGAPMVQYFADRGFDEALRIGRALQSRTDAIIVVAAGPDRKAAALCARTDLDLRPRMKALLETHHGKGGGSPGFYQGAFSSLTDLESFLAEVRQDW